MQLDPKVLIVDDCPDTRRAVVYMLRESGFRHVTQAEDGVAALEALEKAPIDIIIADRNMPRMNGIELLRAMRQNPRTAEIPFLMLTAVSDNELVAEAIQLGVSDYVVKPFSTITLIGKFRKILARLAVTKVNVIAGTPPSRGT